VTSADAYCRELANKHYENFAVASWIVPAPLRLDLMRFYAFCRTTDDLGDESGSREAAFTGLARWREETEAFFAGEEPSHPVLVALRDTVDRHGLDAQPFLDLIAANVQDQTVLSYQTWPELLGYCMLSAAPVGRVVFAGGEPGDRSGRMPWISQGGPLDRAGAGAYMPLPLRRAGEITSCKSGAVELSFLFCVGFGAHQSKSFGGPVFRGHWRLRFDL